jgi:DNA polymerase-3 subunit alpha
MGKKNPEVMAKMRGKFLEGAKKNGHNEKKAAYIFELMEHFAGYGFNKSHSTAYAFLAYQTAYLKAQLPVALRRRRCSRSRRRTPTSWRSTSASAATAASRSCRPTSTRAAGVHRRAGTRRQVRAHRDQERRRGRDSSRCSQSATKGRIRSIHALCEDLDLRLVNKRVFESLVKAARSIRLRAGTEYEGLSTRDLRPRLIAYD